jgi:S-adenosylhomocysteine hydrolase
MSLGKLGVELETLRDDQAAYIGVPMDHSNQNIIDTK